MSQIITARFEDGVLKPDKKLDLPARARVRLTVEPLEQAHQASEQDWQELEQLWQQASVNSAGARLTRDQLHERS